MSIPLMPSGTQLQLASFLLRILVVFSFSSIRDCSCCSWAGFDHDVRRCDRVVNHKIEAQHENIDLRTSRLQSLLSTNCLPSSLITTTNSSKHCKCYDFASQSLAMLRNESTRTSTAFARSENYSTINGGGIDEDHRSCSLLVR